MPPKNAVEMQFKSLQEEVAYLREKVTSVENSQGAHGPEAVEHIVRHETKEYARIPEEIALAEGQAIVSSQKEAIVLELTPKGTDAQIEELLGILEMRGLHNALSILEKLNNPELEDDFHRFLVQYIKSGHLSSRMQKEALKQGLHMTLYEVTLPVAEKDKAQSPEHLKTLFSSMEQFYAGMRAVSAERGDFWFSLEVAVSNEGRGIFSYVAVPDDKRDLFEKQFLAIFPQGKLKEQKEDYTIFGGEDEMALSVGVLKEKPVFPLKTHDMFSFDPLNIVLNSFSKIAESGEGAALQVLIGAPKVDYSKLYRDALQNLSKGMPLHGAIDIRETFVGEVSKDLFHGIKETFFEKKKNPEEPPEQKTGEAERIAMENIKRKIESPILVSNIRLIAAAGSKSRAEAMLSELEASFNQFEDPKSNTLQFSRVSTGKLLSSTREYIFRLFNSAQSLPLSLSELATVFHFPGTDEIAATEFKRLSMATAPAPAQFDERGILLGVNKHRGEEKKIYFSPEDRLRHSYVIGQTGTGKSSLLKNMIIQDIKNGEGVGMIDPHGSDIVDVLASIPKERYHDVIYFDPSYTPRPMGLNMLEYDVRYPEQKTFVVNELLSIFNKLFDMKTAGGPAFEQYFRNSALLVMEHPESGNTLLEIARVLSDKAYRDLKLSHSKNPIVNEFWRNAEKTSGEQSLANYVPYITNKFDNFISNEIMRPVIAQEKSAFNFRDIMDSKKIFLVNLSKGRLGDINSHLLGLIVVGKFLMAALSRVDSFDKNLPPFYLYLDEFQNITTDSIATILSEARKYRLSLTVAHQYIAQLDDQIKNAVFGNVGSLVSFRVGADDAEFLEKQFAPVFTAKDLMNIENRNAYMKMLVRGVPEKPFSMETAAVPAGDRLVVDSLRELSYLTYGKERADVEADILRRYQRA